MQFLYNNIVVFHVFAVCAVFAWLFGGTRGDYLLPVMPWVTALLVEVMVCFPQHHDGETTYEARERVWEAMRKDPLVWLSLGFILLLLVPFLNVGLCPVCDYPAIQAGADPKPLIPFFPFCVNRMEHLNVVMPRLRRWLRRSTRCSSAASGCCSRWWCGTDLPSAWSGRCSR